MHDSKIRVICTFKVSQGLRSVAPGGRERDGGAQRLLGRRVQEGDDRARLVQAARLRYQRARRLRTHRVGC